MSWAGHVERMRDRRGAYRVLLKKPEGKKPQGRPRRRCEDNIKMDLRKWDVGVWTRSLWLRQVAGTCECGNENSEFIKCEEFLD
jgi:hypothetical protein